MGTSVERSTAMTDLAAKFDAYGVENEKVDGMDLEAVLGQVLRDAAGRGDGHLVLGALPAEKETYGLARTVHTI